MNERIQELKQQATFYANKEFAATGSHELWTDMFGEKFAELLVRECISALDEDDGATHHSELLLEHFGVEK